MKQTESNHPITAGFSLVEILLALIILSGSIIGLLGGFQSSLALTSQSSFESKAAMWAEREMELLKADLLARKRDPVTGGQARGRFRLPRPWRAHLLWTARDPSQLTRLRVSVVRGTRSFALESHLYAPEGAQ